MKQRKTNGQFHQLALMEGSGSVQDVGGVVEGIKSYLRISEDGERYIVAVGFTRADGR